MNKPKHETCKFSDSIGEIAVYVTPGCPRATLIRGRLVSSKTRCEECRSWKERQP